MKAIRDVAITVVIVAGLLGALLALPFIVFLITLCAVGFIVYAVIHDSRLQHKIQKEESNNENITNQQDF